MGPFHLRFASCPRAPFTRRRKSAENECGKVRTVGRRPKRWPQRGRFPNRDAHKGTELCSELFVAIGLSHFGDLGHGGLLQILAARTAWVDGTSVPTSYS